MLPDGVGALTAVEGNINSAKYFDILEDFVARNRLVF